MRKIKFLLLKLLPEGLLFELKKFHYVRALKSFSEKEVQVVKLLVKPGEYVIDIGANVGWYTRILSELVGKDGRVYSVEPIPLTFELLFYCVRKLGLNNVECFNCALSNKNGSALMEVPLYEAGGENFYEARIEDEKRGSSFRRFKVDLRSIDSLFVDLPKDVAFIKCDVEGHEFLVIEGAKGLITKSRPAWLIEITGNPDDQESSSWALFTYMEKQGYTAYWFDGAQLRRRFRGDKSVNYFFLTSQHLATLKMSGISIHSGPA
jgi:FkbM family methyltransferase